MRTGTVVVWALTAPFIFGTACRPLAEPELAPSSHSVEVGELFTSNFRGHEGTSYRLALNGGLRLYELTTDGRTLGDFETVFTCEVGCAADILCYKAGEASLQWLGTTGEPFEAPVDCSGPDPRYKFAVNSSFARIEGHCGAAAVVVEMTATTGFSELEATVEVALSNQETEVRETLTFTNGECLGSSASPCFVDGDQAYLLFDRKTFGSETSFEIEVSEPGAELVTNTSEVTCPGGTSSNNGVVSNVKPVLINPCEHLAPEDVAAAFAESELPPADEGFINDELDLAGCGWGGVTSFEDPWEVTSLQVRATVFQTGLATGQFDAGYWGDWEADAATTEQVAWSPNGRIKTVSSEGITSTVLVAKLIEDNLGRDIHIEVGVTEAWRENYDLEVFEPLGPDDTTLVAQTLAFGKLLSDAVRAAQPDGVVLPPEGE